MTLGLLLVPLVGRDKCVVFVIEFVAVVHFLKLHVACEHVFGRGWENLCVALCLLCALCVKIFFYTEDTEVHRDSQRKKSDSSSVFFRIRVL